MRNTILGFNLEKTFYLRTELKYAGTVAPVGSYCLSGVGAVCWNQRNCCCSVGVEMLRHQAQ